MMLHWSPTLIDDFSDTEDCDSRRKTESSECTFSDQQLGGGWMGEKRRQVLYIPSLQSDQEIFDYALEDIAMPSVSFSEEQAFEKTVQSKDHNSNIIFESAETLNMDTGILESKDFVISAPDCMIDLHSGKDETRFNNKRLRRDDFHHNEGLDTSCLELNLQQLEASFSSSCAHRQAFSSTVDSCTPSDDSSANFLDGNGDLCHPSDPLCNKENIDVVVDNSESEDLYDMQHLRDSLPKLKVMTPASLHNEISGAFMSYSEMEASETAWLVPISRDLLEAVATTSGESEHDTSFCSVDSAMTVSSVESLPKVFYDPDLHRSHHLTAVSVPPLRRGLNLVSAECHRSVESSKASFNSDRSQQIELKSKTQSYFRNGTGGLSTASRLRTPEPGPSCGTSFSTSSKSRFARRPEPTASKAMVKLVFPSPSKSSSLNGFAVGNHRTDSFMELYSHTYGKRVRGLRTSAAEDCLDSKRRCQRSTTPQMGTVKTEPKTTKSWTKNDELSERMSCALSSTAPRKQTSSVPRDHRLGISGATSLHSRLTVQSSDSASGHSVKHGSSHHRNLFLLEPKRLALVSCDDNSSDICQNVTLSGQCHGMDNAGSGDRESGCRARKRPLLSPGKVVNKRALTLTPPLLRRNPLLQKFFDNIPAVTATNVMQYSDDQMEAVTLRNTLLNRDQINRPSKADVATQQTASARPPSRLTWRADLVTMVTEGSKVPATDATKARKSILNVRSCVESVT